MTSIGELGNGVQQLFDPTAPDALTGMITAAAQRAAEVQAGFEQITDGSSNEHVRAIHERLERISASLGEAVSALAGIGPEKDALLQDWGFDGSAQSAGAASGVGLQTQPGAHDEAAEGRPEATDLFAPEIQAKLNMPIREWLEQHSSLEPAHVGRAANLLRRHHYHLVRDLLVAGDDALYIRDLGPKSRDEIERTLRANFPEIERELSDRVVNGPGKGHKVRNRVRQAESAARYCPSLDEIPVQSILNSDVSPTPLRIGEILDEAGNVRSDLIRNAGSREHLQRFIDAFRQAKSRSQAPEI